VIRIDSITFAQGANMMAPGLLSAGGDLPAGLPANSIVAIHAEGKESAAGIGKLTASSEEIRKAGKGVAVEVMCYLGWVFRSSLMSKCKTKRAS
jgi:predicted RNA-binding protein (TIGR00451 family)